MSLIRQLGVLLVLAGLGWGGYWAYDRHLAPAAEPAARGGPPRDAVVPVEVIGAAMERFDHRVEAVGTTHARQSVAVVPLASGRLVALGAGPGTEVEAGQMLARLDDDIERADLTQAEARLREAVSALERARQLRRSNAMAEATLEQLVALEAVARAELDRARRRLADRTIKAPFAGRVGLRQVDVGARVEETTMLTTLDDLSEVEVEFAVPEMLFGSVAVGAPAEATGAAFGDRRFLGQVTAIDSRIDPVSRAFKVRASLPNPDRSLPAGMFMRVTVILEVRNVLTIPDQAISAQGSETFVFLVEDGRAVRRTLTVGERQAGQVEVRSGLAAGSMVVVRGVQRLRDGIAVRVVNDLGPAAAPIASPPTAGNGA